MINFYNYTAFLFTSSEYFLPANISMARLPCTHFTQFSLHSDWIASKSLDDYIGKISLHPLSALKRATLVGCWRKTINKLFQKVKFSCESRSHDTAVKISISHSFLPPGIDWELKHLFLSGQVSLNPDFLFSRLPISHSVSDPGSLPKISLKKCYVIVPE